MGLAAVLLRGDKSEDLVLFIQFCDSRKFSSRHQHLRF